MAGVVLSETSVAASPGGQAVCTVTVRNSSAVVDSYTLTVLGEAAAWATPVPATLSLFPGTDGTVEIHFRPPRVAATPAGPVDFAVRVASSQFPDESTVEEGVVVVDPFVDITARVTPRTSETRRRARHVVSIENRGNAPVTVAVTASDPDEALAFDVTPPTVTVERGETAAVAVGVAARSGFARGPAQHRPFQVSVVPPVESAHPPVMLDAAVSQKAGMPRFLPALAAAAVVLVLAAVLVPPLLKDRDGGTFSLSSAANPTTTTAGEGEDEGEEGEGEGEAVAEATPSEEKGEGRQEEQGGASEPGATTTSALDAASGGSKPGGATTTSLADGPASTSEEAPEQVSTTTTAPPAHAKWLGNWVNPTNTGNEGKMTIRADASKLYVHGYGFCGGGYCDWGEASTTLTDASDNSITITYNFGFKTTRQVISYLASSDQVRTSSTDTYSDGRQRFYSDTFDRR